MSLNQSMKTDATSGLAMRSPKHFLVIVGPRCLSNIGLAGAQSSCVGGGCGISQSAIDAYPHPNVSPLRIDEELLYDRDYRQINGDLVIYDQPAGESN